MPGAQERILRRRIKSVQSTKKITRAMELIAASRIVKAQQRVHAARPYADQLTSVIGNLAAAGAGQGSTLLKAPGEVRTVAHVVVSADRGLAGSYNSAVIRSAERAIQADVADGRAYRLICVGKKSHGYFRFRRYDIEASYIGFSDSPTYENAREIAQFVTTRFEQGEYDIVKVSFTRFVSAGVQQAETVQYLPLETAAPDSTGGPTADYEFEPSAGAILDAILPRYAEARLYSMLLDAAASEHAARQRAMKSATDNAEELITKLSRQMNRARQDAITTEIMEIVGGAEALRSGSSEDLLADTIELRTSNLFESRSQP